MSGVVMKGEFDVMSEVVVNGELDVMSGVVEIGELDVMSGVVVIGGSGELDVGVGELQGIPKILKYLSLIDTILL